LISATPGAVMEALIVRQLGQVAYQTVYDRMRQFTHTRTGQTPDEIWLVEHPPVFTLGKAADCTNILDASGIPVVWTDRGGDVTYHGFGQAVVYLLLDLHRRFNSFWVRDLVFRIEASILKVLAKYKIQGERHPGAPGIYIPARHGAKIAAIGLKVNSRGCSYHGLALNVDMDLTPFCQINPCGYPGLTVTDMKTERATCQVRDIQTELIQALAVNIGFSVTEDQS